MPGTKIFSVATTGCNWLCSYCQNFDISQRRKIEGLDVTPEKVVEMTRRYGCQGLAYTYNEPSIFIEFAHDIGVQARRAGLVNIFVSNGYDTPATVDMMADFLDCITVDFKGSGETSFVRKYIGIANAEPIFQTLLNIRDRTNVHIEITDLVVPQVGDDLGAAKKLSSWVYDNLGPDTPIHFLRFHPDYKMMNLPPTPTLTLEKHHAVAKAVGLNYVYIGNVPGHPLEHTYCPECGGIVVERMGFDITGWNLDGHNRCKSCGNEIPIVGRLSKSVNEERFMPVLM
jgi:pyruvate formate lyase activating enzyme